MELLNRAPLPAVRDPVSADIRAALAELPARQVYVRMVQPGRTLYILVHVLLPEEDTGLNVAALDAVRQDVIAAVARTQTRFLVDVVFTANEQLAAPNIGFQDIWK